MNFSQKSMIFWCWAPRNQEPKIIKKVSKKLCRPTPVLGHFFAILGYFSIYFFQFFFDNLLEGTFSILNAKLAPQSTLLEVILETFWCPGGNVKTVVSYWF